MVNTSDRYLSDCQLRVEFERSGLAVLARFPPPELPPTPGAFGEATRMCQGSSTQLLLPSDDVEQDTSTSFNTVTFDIGDLRPRAVAISAPVGVLVFAPPVGATLEAAWNLTARDLHAVVSGSCAIALTGEPWPAINQDRRSGG